MPSTKESRYPSGSTLEMPGREQWVEVLGVTVRYFCLGEGPPVVLIHGLGEAAVVWYGNVESLATQFSTYALDLPGHGASDKPDWDYSLEETVDFLIAFMDALNLERASLVGNSLGGLIALATALAHPCRVERLVLEDCAGLGREIAWFLRLMTVPYLGELLARPAKKGLRWFLERIFHSSGFATEALVEALHWERRRPGNTAAMLQILRKGVSLRGVKSSFILTQKLAKLEAPTLLVWGRQGRILPAFHGERAAPVVPQGRLTVFDHCGHWPHIEVQERFNDLLLDFLSEETHISKP